MRNGRLAFLITFAVCLAGVLVLGLTRTSDLVYSPGVVAGGPVAGVAGGQRACQAPIQLPDDTSFDRVAVTAGSAARPAPRLAVEVVDAASSARLASGSAEVGAPAERVVRTGRVETADPLRICFANRDAGTITLYGQPGIASPRSSATVGGKPIDFDIAVELRTEPRSLVALLPTMAERASLFRAGWVTPVTYLVLGLLLLVGAPLALMRGIARAEREDGDAPVGAQAAPEKR